MDERSEPYSLADAQRHFPDRVLSLSRLHGSGNSIVYRVTSARRDYVLKRYAPVQADGYDRGTREFQSLSFLWARGFRNIPQALTYIPGERVGIYSFERGRILSPEAVAEEDILSLVDFIAGIYALGDEDKMAFGPERTACLSLDGYVRTIRTRLDRILEDPSPCGSGHDARDFIEGSLRPRFDALVTDFAKKARESGYEPGVELPIRSQVLTPGDFGFHNILADGWKRVFLDFEYFGRDDPARHVLHFLHHDQSRAIRPELKQLFLDALRDKATFSDGFDVRLRLVDPLVGMEWVVLYLNILSNAQQRHAMFSRGNIGHLAQARLAKAKNKLNHLSYFA